jgi:hypothetical protein
MSMSAKQATRPDATQRALIVHSLAAALVAAYRRQQPFENQDIDARERGPNEVLEPLEAPASRRVRA